DLSCVEAAVVVVGKALKPGATVVLESTSYPGTTEEVVLPLLEKWSGLSVFDFHLGFSPERIDPGDQTYGFRNTAKLVSGLSDCWVKRVVGFSRTVVDTVVPTPSMAVAEMAKVVENIF